MKLRKHRAELKLFPAHAPLDYVAIDILGPLIQSKDGYKYILVISDRFSKLTGTVPLETVNEKTVAQAFLNHWAFVYGPPRVLLTDNGKQFVSKFFREVCRVIGTNNLYTTTYNAKCNGQVERFNRTVLNLLRTYVGEHPRD